MGELINRLRNQLNEFYGSLSNTRKMLLAAGAVVLVLFVAGILFFATRKEYVPIVQGVTAEEAAGITAKLDELAIPWKDQNVTTITVPKEELSKAKMALAVEGLLTKKDFTWTDAFAKSSLTMSNDEKNKMYLVAQATGLEQSIESIEGIEAATVNLYVPGDTTYLLNKDYESRASVIIKMKQGVALDKAQVNGIVMILVNSVKGLDQSRVSIVDSTGRELNKSGDVDSDSYTASSQYEMQTTVETRLNKQITEFLESLYGKDNVKVLLSVKLDFDGEQTTRKVFSPPIEGESTGMLRSASEITENVVNGSNAQGVPGTDSNTETTNYAEPGSGQSDYNKASKTLNYELNEINTVLTKSKGQVKDITVSILINSEKLVDKTLTDEHKQEVISLVTAAAGLDTRSVQVSAQKFAPDEDLMAVNGDTATGGIPLVAIIGGVIALLATIGGVVFFLKKRKEAAAKSAAAEKAKQDAHDKEMEAIQLAQDTSSPKYQIEKFIDTNPEIVAQLLRNWINED